MPQRTRPAWIDSIHAISNPEWIALDADQLLDEAVAIAGHDDFGGTGFQEPYRIFVQSCADEAQLHTVGRLLMRSDLLNWLVNRLELTAFQKENPRILDEELDAPLFITGLPRTGTSILHDLLACDPAARIPLHWEVRYPCPAPERASYSTDPRIARADREIQLWNQIVPEYVTMHELGGAIPVECIQITAHEFVSDELLGRAQVPRYAAWLASADLEPAYRFHRQFLQHLQFRYPGRWILKAPSHLSSLKALFAVYPDARVVWTHRDPLKIIPSVASILEATARVRSDAVDPEQVKAWFTPDTCLTQIESAQRFRDSNPQHAERFFDVRYESLVTDPFSTLADIYDHFHIPFQAAAEAAMRRYLEAKPKDKHGRHDYARVATESSEGGAIRERFRAYQERFDVPSEAV